LAAILGTTTHNNIPQEDRLRPRIALQHLRERLPEGLLGGALLFGSTTIVNAGNYAFNLILGRWLGPADFADASLIVTLFLVITFVAVALQMASAKFTAAYQAGEQPAQVVALRRWMGRFAWLAGLVLLALFAGGAPLWQGFFQTGSAWPFAIFALGVPFYFALGVDRGVLQGQTRFGVLSLTYQVEMWARLVIALLLVALGWSVFGAVTALTLSLVATWITGFVILSARRWRATSRREPAIDLPHDERQAVARFAGPVVAALAGQILINNSDVLIVKHFFAAEAAGRYAALALIGRIVFFATWSVVTVLFPIVARRHQRGEPHRGLLYGGLGLVAAISGAIVGATLVAPELIVRVLFGAEYVPVAGLLAPYAIATALYALANVVISYRLSLDHGGGSLLALAAGLVQVAGLWLMHGSLRDVVLVQVFVMAGLFIALLCWDGWLAHRERGQLAAPIANSMGPPAPAGQEINAVPSNH
jgi:O-antigen/teichoic acid export membrane protein